MAGGRRELEGKADEPEGMQAISIELVHLIALDPCLQIF